VVLYIDGSAYIISWQSYHLMTWKLSVTCNSWRDHQTRNHLPVEKAVSHSSSVTRR